MGPGFRAVLLPVLLAVAGCGRHTPAPPVGVDVRVAGPAAVRVMPGARGVTLLELRLRGVAPSARVLSSELSVRFPAGAPAPLARLGLAVDLDGDGRFDPEVDEWLAAYRLEDGGRRASAALSRTIPAEAEEHWLVVGDLAPVSTGMDLSLGMATAGLEVRDEGDRGLAAAAAGPLAGPQVSVVLVRLATSSLLTGGGARAALVLSSTLRPARVLLAGNPATDLREEAPGLYSFLLPPTPPGKVEVRVLDGSGVLLERFVADRACNAGAGPARFVDRSLALLPRDHAFSQDAEAADMDGDGTPDLLVPSYSGQPDRLYLNDGFGRFRDVSATHMPGVLADTVHMEPVDVDGDGDVDVALAVEGGQNRLYLNDGTGRLTDVTGEAGRMPVDADYSEDVQAGDLDGDGDLDLVWANLVDPKDQRKGGQVRIYRNDGKGSFSDVTSTWMQVEALHVYDVELGDLDGDGDLDLFVACYGERNRLYRNGGDGRLTDVSAGLPDHVGFHTSAALGDVDGDGALDILVGTFLGPCRLYLNRGAMQWADGSAGLVQEEMSTYDVALGDLDGDGDLDVIHANTANPSVLALNDGKGRFTAVMAPEFATPDDNAYDVQLLDADGDGALDVLITAWGDRQDTLYLSRPRLPAGDEARVTRVEPNYGPPAGRTWVTLRGAGFRDGLRFFLGGQPLTEVTVQDERTATGRVPPGQAGAVDLDLVDLDGTARHYADAYLYEQPPPGAFEDVTEATLGAEYRSTTAVVAGDLDGDGLPDLVFADQGAGARVRLNSSSGRLTAGSFPTISASANDLALADLDGDGRLDLILVDAAGPPWLFPGKGDGTFATPVRLAEPKSGAEEVAVGDLDGDGDPDLVFAVSGPELVLRNDGSLKFTPTSQPGLASDPSKGSRSATRTGTATSTCSSPTSCSARRLNDGKGALTESKGALPDNAGDQSYGIALADVDGDGDLDAALANGGAQVDRLFLNGGKGTFAEAPSGVFRAALGGGAHVTFADVDLDGDPDLFSSHFWGNNHLYITADGRLAERAGMLPNTPGGFAGACFADLDGDGDPDLVLAAFWGGSRVLRNPRRP
ncbi:MAG: FG-GAP-like repeat-containing protein [Planctomycetota bacterium]